MNARKLDKSINYAEYLSESLDKYLSESLDKSISYAEYLSETIGTIEERLLRQKSKKRNDTIDKILNEHNLSDDESDVKNEN